MMLLPVLIACNMLKPMEGTNPAATMDSPANSLNPYDYAGQLALKIATSSLKAYKQNGNSANLSKTAHNNADKIRGFKAPAPSLDPDQLKLSNEDPLLEIENIIATANLSEIGSGMLNIYLQLIVYFVNDRTYNQMMWCIKSFESAIISEYAIPPADKKLLLVTTSLTRYSIYFQHTHLNKYTWNVIPVIRAAVTHGKTDIQQAIISAVAADLNANYKTLQN